jgi:hypothetical protein
MNSYLEGASNQLIKRGKLLLGKIPRNLPRELHLLEQRCRDRIQQVLTDLQQILVELKKSPYARSTTVRLRALRRAVRELDYLETIGIAALNRADLDEEVWLNELLLLITKETQYPLLPPVVISLSQSYFRIHTDLNLVLVPLAEGAFLLHLPDLYHELAHPLTVYPNDPRVEPLQIELLKVLDCVLLYNTEEIEKLDRRGEYEELKLRVALWNKCWLQFWGFEFFCDLFSIYTVGPAYAWSHYHLCAKRGANPFEVPRRQLMSHPADDARMQAMLRALEQIGFTAEVENIGRRWDELTTISGFKPHSEYYRCYPDHIITRLAQHSLVGTQAIGCTVVGPSTTDGVFQLLNGAWLQFWKDPHSYSVWEQHEVDSLRFRSASLN